MWGQKTATLGNSLHGKVSGINHLENENLWKVMGLMHKEFKSGKFSHLLVDFFCFFFDLGLVSILEILTGFPETQILSCMTRTQSAESETEENTIPFINSWICLAQFLGPKPVSPILE